MLGLLDKHFKTKQLVPIEYLNSLALPRSGSTVLSDK